MSKELKIGLIALLIIILTIWGFNFMKGQSLFEVNKRIFKTSYSNVEGLNTSSLVTINGKPVGKVTKVDFHPEHKYKMLVVFSLDNNIKFSKTSIAKMYVANMVSGVQNIAIIPKYNGEEAVSGDILIGVKDLGMLGNIQDKLLPLQSKIDGLLVGADSLVSGFNSILNVDAQKSINRSVIGFEKTINQMNTVMLNVNTILKESEIDIKSTLANSKKITNNFSKLSGDLARTDIQATIVKFENSLKSMDGIITGIKNGRGTLGKLITNDEMYNNLTNATKEMEELLREMKLHPKRFVHFSVFGKKQKKYSEIKK